MKDKKVVFGWDLSIDLVDCNDHVTDPYVIKNFANGLCDVIDMTPYGDPQTPYFGENSEITKGHSLLQFVETSSITGHFSDHYKSAHIDIFSCKDFDEKKALKYCIKIFGGRAVTNIKQTRYCK